MNPFDPANVVNLSGTGTMRGVTLALPTDRGRDLLPNGLELGSQSITGPGTHPVMLGFHDIFRLHQYLIGLRRRHPWLHTARTSPLQLTNRQYVYQTRAGNDALLVALNIDDAPLSLSLSELGFGEGHIVAGSGAPPQHLVGKADVEPHGWLIIAPGAQL